MGDDDVTEDDGDLLCLPLSPTTTLRWVDPSQWSESPLVAVVAVTMLVVVVLITPVILRCVWTLHSTTTNQPQPPRLAVKAPHKHHWPAFVTHSLGQVFGRLESVQTWMIFMFCVVL
jgi:hypothetical protein